MAIKLKPTNGVFLPILLTTRIVLQFVNLKHTLVFGFLTVGFLSDPKKILKKAQEGKTKAMRQWKFSSLDEIDATSVSSYILEAIENQKKGLQLAPTRKTNTKLNISSKLAIALENDKELKIAF